MQVICKASENTPCKTTGLAFLHAVATGEWKPRMQGDSYIAVQMVNKWITITDAVIAVCTPVLSGNKNYR